MRWSTMGFFFLIVWTSNQLLFAQTPRLVTAEPLRPRRVTSSASTPDSNAISPSLAEANSIERRAFEQTNAARVKRGLPPFVWDSALCRMARTHSEQMSRRGFFSHVTPEGSRLKDRVRSVGILHFTVVGENIAYNLGYDDPGGFAVENWMRSPAHRANILDPGFQSMAVGSFVAADGSVYLTQTFIAR